MILRQRNYLKDNYLQLTVQDFWEVNREIESDVFMKVSVNLCICLFRYHRLVMKVLIVWVDCDGKEAK